MYINIYIYIYIYIFFFFFFFKFDYIYIFAFIVFDIKSHKSVLSLYNLIHKHLLVKF